MISLTRILSLLSALVATGDTLSCTTCMSLTSSSCSGDSVTCPSGYQCGSTYQETTAGGKTGKAFAMACVPSSQCTFKGTISLQHGEMKRVSSCCNTDNCIPTIPPFSQQSTEPNGLVCRSCISADTWCYTPDTMQCKGDENMCVLQTTKVTGPVSASMAARGCATQSMCDLGSNSQTLGESTFNVKFICTSGGKSVHPAVLTPAIVCLLLLKLFF